MKGTQDTIGALLAARAADTPCSVRLIDALTGAVATADAVDATASRWAAWVLGVAGPDGRLAAVLPNGFDLVHLFLGAARAGVTLCPYNPALTDAELGALVIVGRKKDMTNRGGEKLAPDAIEAVLRACPGVTDVAVFGIPDERLGEGVAAAIVAPGVADDALWDHGADHMAEFATPRHWVRVTELPRGPTGKILRRELQARFLAGGTR